MGLDRLEKLFASSIVTNMIDADAGLTEEKLADLTFKEIEELYQRTLYEVESSPEIRHELVDSLKAYQQEHGDLNQLYSAEEIASDPELQSIIVE